MRNLEPRAAARCARCGTDLPRCRHHQLGEPDEELSELRRATRQSLHIVKRLGSGGMAHVYLARHAALSRSLVVKVLTENSRAIQKCVNGSKGSGGGGAVSASLCVCNF